MSLHQYHLTTTGEVTTVAYSSEVGSNEGQCELYEIVGNILVMKPGIICTLPIFTFLHDLLLDQLTGENRTEIETIYLCSIDELTLNTNLSADITYRKVP